MITVHVKYIRVGKPRTLLTSIDLFDEKWMNSPIVLRANQGITVLQDSNAGFGSVSVSMYFGRS